MGTNYEFDENQASKADSAADRIDTSAAYVGVLTKAWAVESQSGTTGIGLHFDAGADGKTETTIWTVKENGEPAFGMAFLQSMMLMFGLRSLKAEPGLVEEWDDDANKRIEVEGEIYPELCGKRIGLVLQKELTSKKSGGDSFRMSIYGVFHHESKLTASEIRERKVKPMKLDKLLKGLKDKDNRKKAEPDQPSMAAAGIATGSF